MDQELRIELHSTACFFGSPFFVSETLKLPTLTSQATGLYFLPDSRATSVDHRSVPEPTRTAPAPQSISA